MLHKSRTWCVTAVGSAEELAEKLTQHTWTLCTAFELDGYVYANDATSADGAQEYAVLRRDGETSEFVQLESITFSWCSEVQALALIRRISAGEINSCQYGWISAGRFETPTEHGRCLHCQ